ncbi:MAG TPA: glycosyltransferase family 87 protein [Ktedonobacteraceae bacterium]
MRDTDNSAFERDKRVDTPAGPPQEFPSLPDSFVIGAGKCLPWGGVGPKRTLLLCFLLLLSLAHYLVLIAIASQSGDSRIPFLLAWLICFLPYIVACIFVLATKPLVGRWFRVEMAILIFGALLFRLLLLPLPVNLSPDVWRYLWDAHVFVHGYSPYAYAPADKVLLPLHNILLTNSRFRNTPTKYPPGAELFFVIGYWLSATNLWGIKGMFIACDMLTCGALAWLLSKKRLDARRVIIYAWCPLPIVEFAIEGHLDVLVIMFTVLALLSATIFGTNEHRGQILTGFLIGLATLIKLYPILLLVVFFRGRNWILILTCFVTILLGYIPFFLLGHGQVLAVLLSFTGQQQYFESVIGRLVEWNSAGRGLTQAAIMRLTDGLEALIIGTVALVVFILRLRGRIGTAAATVVLIGTILTCYSHLFPWYAPALLPWIAVLASPLRAHGKLSGRGLAIASVWYFTFVVILSYMLGLRAFDTRAAWSLYYEISFGVVLIGIGVAALVAYRSHIIRIRMKE